jgi:zinc transport system substrate-binding protein
VLNPLEGLSDDEVAAGDDYFSVMRANLAALRKALGCR